MIYCEGWEEVGDLFHRGYDFGANEKWWRDKLSVKCGISIWKMIVFGAYVLWPVVYVYVRRHNTYGCSVTCCSSNRSIPSLSSRSMLLHSPFAYIWPSRITIFVKVQDFIPSRVRVSEETVAEQECLIDAVERRGKWCGLEHCNTTAIQHKRECLWQRWTYSNVFEGGRLTVMTTTRGGANCRVKVYMAPPVQMGRALSGGK